MRYWAFQQVFIRRLTCGHAYLGCLAGMLAGCGTVVPSLQEFWVSSDETPRFIQQLTRSVHCEVRNAVDGLILDDIEAARLGANGERRVTTWLDSWGAQISLSLSVEEPSARHRGCRATRRASPELWVAPIPRSQTSGDTTGARRVRLTEGGFLLVLRADKGLWRLSPSEADLKNVARTHCSATAHLLAPLERLRSAGFRCVPGGVGARANELKPTATCSRWVSTVRKEMHTS